MIESVRGSHTRQAKSGVNSIHHGLDRTEPPTQLPTYEHVRERTPDATFLALHAPLSSMGSLQANPGALTSPLAPSKRLDRKPDIHHIVLGDILFDTWYPSFYPDELVGKELDRLYVCQSCFKYSKEQQQYLAHLVSKHPFRTDTYFHSWC